MKIYSEKEAEEFLRRQGFEVIESFFVDREKLLEDFLKKVEYPIVMKVSGKEIIHKKKIFGVRVGISDYNSAVKSFEDLMNLDGAEEVLIQKQIFGKELLLGIKKTDEFGHVLSFGQGGSLVEEIADVCFRVCPLEKKEIVEMVEETEIGGVLSSKEKGIVVENLVKLCFLVERFSNIQELDINPLILANEKGIVVDARISFEE